MKVQAEKILKDPTAEQMLTALQQLMDITRDAPAVPGHDDIYTMVIVRTPHLRQSQLEGPMPLPPALVR
jgi:hypothetical protein